MPDLILHHYNGSPYAEKIRLILGFKGLVWRSAITAAVPPRPALESVLGGFRRTPVLQIGANYFCDTRLIAELLEQIAPEPTLYPDRSAVISALISNWVEPRVFMMMGPARFTSARDVDGIFDGTVAAGDFFRDRSAFIAPALDAARFTALQQSAWDHLRSFLSVLEQLLTNTSTYLCGDRPALADFAACHLVWWLLCMPSRKDALANFPHVLDWAERMQRVGHGNSSPIAPEETVEPAILAQHGELWELPWPQQEDLTLGSLLTIMPDDYGRTPVSGTLRAISERHVTLERFFQGQGSVYIHFPRHGYEITANSAPTSEEAT